MPKLDNRSTCMVVYNRYPSDPRVRRASEALVRRGYNVHVICSSEEGRPDDDVFNDVQIHRVRVPKISGAKWSNALAMLLFMWHSFLRVNTIHRNFRPAIYHIHSLPDFLVGVCLWPKLRGAKIILDLHESFPEIVLARFRTKSRFLYSVAAWLERMSCLFSDRVIVVNETIRRLVVKRGEDPSSLTVIMNSPMVSNANEEEIRIHPKVTEACDSGFPLFVYAGGINAERDLVALVQAVELLKERGVTLKVLFFTHTETAFIKVIKVQIFRAKLDKEMEFCGVLPAEEVLPNVKRSDIGIVSYERSPLTEVALPNKVFEYMAAEVPMISADLPTLRDLLGECAHYYEPGNYQSLANSIEKILNDTTKEEKVARAKKIYQSCSWEVMEERLVGIYSSFDGQNTFTDKAKDENVMSNESISKGNIVQRVFSVIFLLPAWFAPHKSLRGFFHKLRGVKVGKNVEIGYFCLLDNVHPELITLEDDSVITAGTVILTHDNSYYYTGRGDVKYGPVIIKKQAFIGINSLIMPNVTIGEKAIVGAKSFVIKDVPANAIVAGSPAKIIRTD